MTEVIEAPTKEQEPEVWTTVPNRKDRRKRAREFRAFRRRLAKERDQRNKKRGSK